MDIFTFTIYGNHEDKKGNPIPKLRMTQRGLWTKQAKRYRAWSDFVRSCYWFNNKNMPESLQKPFDKLFAGRMDIIIYWGNEKHGDPEGIFGSIADALFENDKHLDGFFKAYHTDLNNPRVEIVIKTYPQNNQHVGIKSK